MSQIALWLARDGQNNSAPHFNILRAARRFREATFAMAFEAIEIKNDGAVADT
ncbi:hypothetical protein [Candidatus Binatus sp.]|jgi:hypothetical protein